MAIPKTLEDALRKRKVIPFAGAGVSLAVLDKNSGKRLFPSWKELLSRAADRLEDDQKKNDADLVRMLLSVDPPDYLYAARQAMNKLGPVWFNFLKDAIDFSKDQAQPESLKLVDAIWRLGSKLVITTNYDRVLHWNCPLSGDIAVWMIEAPAEQADAFRNGFARPTVWHLHGHIDRAHELILTPDGYERLYPEETSRVEQTYKSAIQTLRTHLFHSTFLFIGFSLEDENFVRQLKYIDEIYDKTAGPHYVLVGRKDHEKIKGRKLPVEMVVYEDHGEPLLRLMYELAGIVESDFDDGSRPAAVIGSGKLQSPKSEYDPGNRVFYVPYNSKGDQVIGREKALEDIRDQLFEGKRTPMGQTAALSGAGGLGKTQAAIEYAWKFQGRYANGVIWLNADQDIAAQLPPIAERAKWAAAESEHKLKLEVARKRLKSFSDCLLIFDNVEKVDDIKEYLPDPGVMPHILITSRKSHPGFVDVPLDLLDDEDSYRLLVQEAGRAPKDQDEENAAREIARDLTGFPLLLEMAGAYLSYYEITWLDYLELLRRNREQPMPPEFKQASFTKHDADLYSTFTISEKALNENPKLAEIIDLISWSGTSSMGLSLLCSLLGCENQRDLAGPLSLGCKLKILQKVKNGERYYAHRQLAKVWRDKNPIEKRLDWVGTICGRLGDWFHQRKEQFEELSNYEAEFDHLVAWRENVGRSLPYHSVRLKWLQAYPSYHRGRYQELYEILEGAMKEFQANGLKDEALEAHLFEDLGFCFNVEGKDVQARTFYEKALDIRMRIFGEKDKDTAWSIHCLGALLGISGDTQRGLELLEKALAIRRELLTEMHADTASTVYAIGISYRQAGDYRKALEYEEQALAIQRKVLTEKHVDTARTLYEVGVSYSNLEEHEKALEYSQKALDIRRELLGENHADTAISLHQVGVTYSWLNDELNSLSHCRRSFELTSELMGKFHNYTVDQAIQYIQILDYFEKKEEACRLLGELISEMPADHAYYRQATELSERICEQPRSEN